MVFEQPKKVVVIKKMLYAHHIEVKEKKNIWCGLGYFWKIVGSLSINQSKSVNMLVVFTN